MNYLHKKYKLSIHSLCKFSVFLIAIFPLFKRGYASVTIFVFFILSIFYFFLKKKKISGKQVKSTIILSSVFIIYLLSTLYSDNLSESLKFLRITIPVFMFPLLFIVFTNFRLSKKYVYKVFYVFVTSLFLSTVIVNFNIGLYNSDIISQWDYRNLFEHFTGVHGTYYSIWLGFSVIVLIERFVNSSNLYKVFFLVIIIYDFYWLWILMARLPFFMTIVLSLNVIIQKISRKKIRYYLYTILLLLLTCFLFINKEKVKEKFKFGIPKGKYELKHLDMTSEEIRTGIYYCSYLIYTNNYFFGVGIGDVNTNLNNCYKEKINSDVYQKFYYNAHNQYLQILLTSGIFGFLFFLYTLYIIIIKAINSKSILYISFCLLCFTCFLTENMLSRHDGVLFFSFFNILLWKANTK